MTRRLSRNKLYLLASLLILVVALLVWRETTTNEGNSTEPRSAELVVSSLPEEYKNASDAYIAAMLEGRRDYLIENASSNLKGLLKEDPGWWAAFSYFEQGVSTTPIFKKATVIQKADITYAQGSEPKKLIYSVSPNKDKPYLLYVIVLREENVYKVDELGVYYD